MLPHHQPWSGYDAPPTLELVRLSCLSHGKTVYVNTAHVDYVAGDQGAATVRVGDAYIPLDCSVDSIAHQLRRGGG